MAGQLDELLNIKEEALENIPTLTDDELYLFNEFLVDLLFATNKQIRNRKYKS